MVLATFKYYRGMDARAIGVGAERLTERLCRRKGWDESPRLYLRVKEESAFRALLG
jgi:hypothetical protein